MTDENFLDKVVVITGAGRGIGLGIARRFGQAGATVVIADLNVEAGSHAADTLRREGLEAVFEPLDVREPFQCTALVEKIGEEHARLDVWVNNAGVTHTGPAESLSHEAWEQSLAVMLSGAFYGAQAAGRYMLQREAGVIVNVASVHGFRPTEERVAYSTAKAGLIMLTQALGIEWARRGVRVVGVAPGVVERGHLLQGVDDPEVIEVYKRRTPMRRFGNIDEVAEAVLYLASDEASYVVGETIRVDGGWVAYQLF